MEIQKDPLTCKVHRLPVGTIATFDGWKVTPERGDGNWAIIETHPEGNHHLKQ